MLPLTWGEVPSKSKVQAVAGHFEAELHDDIRGAQSVVVEKVFEFINAVRNFRERRTHAFLGALDDFGEATRQQVRRIGHAELPHAPLAETAGGDLGIKISPPLVGDPGIEQDEIKDIAAHLSPVEQPDDGNTQPFLIDLGHAAGHAARHHAAHVGVVGDVADEAE